MPANIYDLFCHSKMKQRRKLIIFITGIALIILILWLLSHAGTFLVKESPLVLKADAAVILMGSIADRVLQAADTYKSGLTGRLVIVNNIQYGSEALEPYGVHIPNFTKLSVTALRQLGVPDSSIIHLPGRANSTRDEADTIASWIMRTPGIKTLAVISSAPHTRRAVMIFNDSFSDKGLQIDVISVPSRYSEFNAQKWWTKRSSAKQVFLEWIKLFFFVTVEQWQ